jgi:predicted alpha/beta superfamily hydrolase
MSRSRFALALVCPFAFCVLAQNAFALFGCSRSSDSESPPPKPPPPTCTAPVSSSGATGPPTGTKPTPDGGAPTTIHVHYAGKPGRLSLRGSAAPLAWDEGVALTADEPGLYTWSSTEVRVATELKPVLDETPSRGPNYLVKPGQTIDLYPRFLETRGKVERRWPSFDAKSLPGPRGLWVYLPPTYLENTASRFGVLYMHDGPNLFSPEIAFGGNEWKVDETLDAGAEDGSIDEVIVVGIEVSGPREEELTPTRDGFYGYGGKGDAYLSMLASEIKPMVDAELRTLPSREHTAIMGSSLGGLLSVHAGVQRAGVFGLVGAMSPSTWWDDRMLFDDVSSLCTKPERPLRVYVDSGDAPPPWNDDVLNTRELAARFRSVGYQDEKDFRYVVAAGAVHTEAAWAARLPAALAFLLGPRAATAGK